MWLRNYYLAYAFVYIYIVHVCVCVSKPTMKNCLLLISRLKIHIILFTSWLPGFARDLLPPPLSPLLFVPVFYPPSLGLPGFAQDNCIPEILFFNFMLRYFDIFAPNPPSSGGVGGVGVTFFKIIFLGSS